MSHWSGGSSSSQQQRPGKVRGGQAGRRRLPTRGGISEEFLMSLGRLVQGRFCGLLQSSPV
jgi:hypothetical protein